MDPGPRVLGRSQEMLAHESMVAGAPEPMAYHDPPIKYPYGSARSMTSRDMTDPSTPLGSGVAGLPTANRGHAHLASTTPGFPGPSQQPAHRQRRSSARDEFDGPIDFLPRPPDAFVDISEMDLIPLSTSLHPSEQDDILLKVNDSLSQCAFHFVAKYQFPIPTEPDKRPVRVPADREWTEWCHLLKRLATKRRIPTRVLWNGQIKQLATVLDSSMEMRHAAQHQSRLLKDDRNVLQLVSAGLQVVKMLKDHTEMAFLDNLYMETETVIRARIAARLGR